MIGIPIRFQYVQMPVATADVDALALGIHEQIVRVTARFDCCDQGAIFYRDGSHLGGIPRCYEDSSRIFVERHWKITAALDCPTRGLFAAESIDDGNPVRLR